MNYIRILSKSSLLSSTSSVKSTTPPEEVTKLQSEIDKLKQTVESLKLTVESRDAAIGTLAREKEKLYVELKTAQRTNRNLHQQLEDERDMHSKEKEYFIEEIKRVANKTESESNNNLNDNQGDTINSVIWREIRSKDEVICNICAKYLKVKRSKILVLRELKKLQSESQKACENIIMLLEENRKSMDDLLRKLVENYSSVPPDTKKYLRILRHNANLHYENTQLKVRLTASLHKNYVQEPNYSENNLQKNMNRKRNINSTDMYKKSSKWVRRHKNYNSTNCFSTIYNIASPYLINKSNSDTCLTLLR